MVAKGFYHRNGGTLAFFLWDKSIEIDEIGRINTCIRLSINKHIY